MTFMTKVFTVSPKGKKSTLVFTTPQGYNQFLKDNKEWGLTVLKVEKEIHP